MIFGLMQKGDEVINVTNDFVAIKRKKGEVDIIPLLREDCNWRIDYENMMTIGYGDNIVTYEDENGVRITNF
ncbi:MAG: hypothetical protein E7271_08525 [Lachnospiraceae bacterium]|nr:hypothetical protein [Lachnospiraceae bacterium]